VTGDEGGDWPPRRPRRRPATAGGSRGPDRPRGPVGPRPAGQDARGPGRTAGRAAGGRPAAARPASGRPSGGRGEAGNPRGGAGRAGAPQSGTSRRASARQRGSAAARRAPARARAILRRKNPRGRLNAALLAFAVVLSLFAGRLVQMQGLDWSRYKMLAQKQRTQVLSIPTVRGSISTSDGTVLALTVQTDEVVADPALIAQDKRAQVASELAGPLKMSAAAILHLIDNPPAHEWVPLKQGVSATAASRITSMSLPGITTDPSYSRSYPNGTLAANLVGFTDLQNGDLTGEAGLEQEFNSVLAGKDGSEEVETGADGVPIPLTQAKVKRPVPARNLRLTIQSSIQYAAERECRLRVKQAKAKNCSIVVMDPRTGAILAMAQYPTFNPNKQLSSLAVTRNIAVANVFAPGSTLKPVTVAADLDDGGQTPLSTYRVPWQINVDGFNFHDAEQHPDLRYTVAGILANSLNDGMVQMLQHITPVQQYDLLRSFGLGSVSGLGMPGESAGLLARPGMPDYWRDEPYELSFGQGVGVTAIQMASIYATIANGGVRVRPSIVAGTTTSSGTFKAARQAPGRRVIPAKTAAELMTMMEQVPKVDALQDEPWGLIAGYPVAAKTGTAQVSDTKACKGLCQYGSSYIGIAPAQDPKLVVAVNIQDPTGSYYGDAVAGPVFYNVMEFALQTLKIPPTHARAPNIRLTQP
jgi:cell division protein FtsI (penicillin-binding protein 3)